METHRDDHAGVSFGKSIWTGQSPCCVCLDDAFQFFFLTILRVRCANSEHQRLVHFEGCLAEPLHHLLSVEVELRALSHCVARCIERSVEGVSASEAESVRGGKSQS